MGKKYAIHKDFALLKLIKFNGVSPLIINCINSGSKVLCWLSERFHDFHILEERINSYDNQKLKLSIYSPKILNENTPCLVYYHGGGFYLTATPTHLHKAFYYARHVPCKVIFVHYRLAPKNPFPKGVEDCYSALRWVYENADNLNIDSKKIAVGGDSAGGALAAAVTQMARDRKGPHICFQLLIYPVIDYEQKTKSMKMFDDTPIWNARLNRKMWEYYLKSGDYGMLPYASPIHAKSFWGLPPAYIETAEYDCLRDEAVNYSNALKEAGVTVQLEQTKGTIHGYDHMEQSNITIQSMIRRVRALKESFNLENL